MNPEPLSPIDPHEAALEAELRELEPYTPSASLKDRIRAAAAEIEEPSFDTVEEKIVRPVAFSRPAWIAAAAAIVAAFFSIAVWTQLRQSSPNQPVIVEDDSNKAPLLWNRQPEGVPGSSYTLSDQVFVGQENEGVVEFDEGPMWKIRTDWLNRTEWENPETGIPQEKLEPEQRYIFVPVRHN